MRRARRGWREDHVERLEEMQDLVVARPAHALRLQVPGRGYESTREQAVLDQRLEVLEAWGQIRQKQPPPFGPGGGESRRPHPGPLGEFHGPHPAPAFA